MVPIWRRGVALGLALLAGVALAEQGVSQGESLRCPPALEWTDAVVADAVGLTEAELEDLKRARSLDNTSVCTMPEEKLRRAIWRASNPKPTGAGEWAALRAAQQQDDNGVVRPDGLLRATEQRRAIALRTAAALAQQKKAGGSARLAGISWNQWTAIGPGNIGGRVRAMAFHPSNPAVIWVGSVSGGIWKTVDSGASWQPVNDFMGNLSITSIVVSPTNTNTMYASTGEGFYNADAVRGAGVFKSTDGGSTWVQLASTNPVTKGTAWYYVNRLVVHPQNGDVLLAATNEGLFRSSDGGTSWTLVRAVSRVADVRFNPLNGSYAVFGRGYGGGAIEYSIDGGATWRASNLSPSGRTELGYSHSNTIYASADVANGTIYRSTDFGATWASVSAPGHLASQGWYDNAIWVDPTNDAHLIVGGLDLWRSTNGASSWTKISQWWSAPLSAHADHHVIVSPPNYNGSTVRTVYFGNDGGVYRANDVSTVALTNGWTSLNNGLAITQFYSGAGHTGTNGRIIGGTQDNGSLVYSGSGTQWSAFFGGDGGFSAVDPTNGNYIYGEYVYLNLHRSTTGGTTSASYIYSGISDAGSGSTALFIAPFTLDPNNPNTMLAGGQSLWRSTNVKATPPSWGAILGSTGGGLISQIAVPAGKSDVIWVGRTSGALLRTLNGTASAPTWSQVNVSGMPGRYVLSLLVDPSNTNVVYAGYGGYSNSNLWKTTDGGLTWTSIGGSLPASPVRAIQRHPANPSYLYVGTEVGVFASQDGGLTWGTTNDGPANVSVDQLFWLNSTTLVASTHGRGMFKVDAGATGHAVTITRAGAGSGTVLSVPTGISCGDTCSTTYNTGTTVALTAVPSRGSTFAGWSGGCSGTSSACSVSVTAPQSITATFEPMSAHALLVTRSGGGSGSVSSDTPGIDCGSSCSASFTPGSTVTLTATPSAGSSFAGWTGTACRGTSPTCAVSMTALQSVNAMFSPIPAHVLMVRKVGAGSGTIQSLPSRVDCGSNCSARFELGQTVVLTATAASGSTFAGWSGSGCSGTGDCTVVMSAPRQATASFIRNQRLSVYLKGSGQVVSAPDGVSCGSTISQTPVQCAASFAGNSSVSLTATAANGYEFAGWSGACTGSATVCVVQMTASKAVTASFRFVSAAVAPRP